jgi:hypothetical protein
MRFPFWRKHEPTKTLPQSADARLIADQAMSAFRASLTPEQEAELHRQFAGLSYEEIRKRMAESMARIAAEKKQDGR